MERALQPVVDRRLAGTAAAAAAAAALGALVFLVQPRDLYTLGLLRVFSADYLLLTSLSCVALLPVLVLRRATVQVAPTVFQNNLLWLCSIFSTHLLSSVAVHVAVSLLLGSLYAWIRGYTEPFLVYPKGKHSLPLLNPRYTMMAYFKTAVGLSYAITRYTYQSDQLRFPALQRSLAFRFKSILARALVRSVRLSLFLCAIVIPAFIVVGRPIHFSFAAYAIFRGTTLAKTTSVVGACITNLRLLMRLFSISAYTLVILEATHDLFALHLTSVVLPKPNLGIIVSSLNENLAPYYRYLSIFHVNWIVRYSPELRRQIFNDVESVRPAWKTVSTALISRITDLTLALREAVEGTKTGSELLDAAPSVTQVEPTQDNSTGVTASKEASVDSVQPVTTPLRPGPSVRPLSVSPTQTGAIYPSSKPSMLRNAAAVMFEPAIPGGKLFPTDERHEALVEGAEQPEKEVELPSLIRRRHTDTAAGASTVSSSDAAATGSANAAASVRAPAQTIPAKIPGTREFVDALALQVERLPFGQFLLGETVLRRTACIMRDLPVHVWSIEALSGLVVASAHEDKYGMVHRDVPAVLSTLVALLVAIEKYLAHSHTNLAGRPMPVSAAWRRQTAKSAAWIVPEELHVCVLTLQNAIYRITTTYYSHLSRFEFEQECASRLQAFADFHE
ncbi:Nuclear pore complex subunit [Polyrhizophydium stewartii]|uniref:Nuclear pore complex subunit n=1 Tax=Polyrhizophydium stewartii TaxID=2732419 RepID=A0ABR4NIY6_9FUNG